MRRHYCYRSHLDRLVRCGDRQLNQLLKTLAHSAQNEIRSFVSANDEKAKSLHYVWCYCHNTVVFRRLRQSRQNGNIKLLKRSLKLNLAQLDAERKSEMVCGDKLIDVPWVRSEHGSKSSSNLKSLNGR